MLVGIVFQLVAITIYVMLAAEFIMRYLKKQPFKRAHNDPPTGNYVLDKKMKLMLFNIGISTLCLFIRYADLFYSFITLTPYSNILHRSIYRTVELSNGWNGPIITTEVYFSAYLSKLALQH